MPSRRHLLKPIGQRFYQRHLVKGRRVHAWLAARPADTARWGFRAALALYPAAAAVSWLRVATLKATGRRPSVLWAPTPILTISESSEVLSRLGYNSETLVFTTYFISSDFDHNAHPLVANPATAPWFPNALFIWSLLRYDIFHFFYDGGLWSGMKIVPAARSLELPLLRIAGKRVILSAYGADVRVKSINERHQPFNICAECPAPKVHCLCDDDRLDVASFSTDWSNAALAMGDMWDFVPGSRHDVPYWPIDTATVPFVGVSADVNTVVIAHSPNHREFKGTRFLIDAVDRLCAAGYRVQLDLIERVSNREAKERYAAADIVVAQCLAGWIGYTELESMAMGKPTVSYLRDDRYMAPFGTPPLVSADPSELYSALKHLVADPLLRVQLGAEGRAWVDEYWSYEAVAGPYAELHDQVWRRNGLLRLLRQRWSDVMHGRGWSSSKVAVDCDPILGADLQRLGGLPPSYLGSQRTQVAAEALIRAFRPEAGANHGAGRSMMAAVSDDASASGCMIALALSSDGAVDSVSAACIDRLAATLEPLMDVPGNLGDKSVDLLNVVASISLLLRDERAEESHRYVAESALTKVVGDGLPIGHSRDGHLVARHLLAIGAHGHRAAKECGRRVRRDARVSELKRVARAFAS